MVDCNSEADNESRITVVWSDGNQSSKAFDIQGMKHGPELTHSSTLEKCSSTENNSNNNNDCNRETRNSHKIVSGIDDVGYNHVNENTPGAPTSERDCLSTLNICDLSSKKLSRKNCTCSHSGSTCEGAANEICLPVNTSEENIRDQQNPSDAVAVCNVCHNGLCLPKKTSASVEEEEAPPQYSSLRYLFLADEPPKYEDVTGKALKSIPVKDGLFSEQVKRRIVIGFSVVVSIVIIVTLVVFAFFVYFGHPAGTS